MMLNLLMGRIDTIDVQIERVERLIEGGAALDPELAAGLATTEPMPVIQRKIDNCAASIEALEKQLKALKAASRR
jgi:hypothetical protein